MNFTFANRNYFKTWLFKNQNSFSINDYSIDTKFIVHAMNEQFQFLCEKNIDYFNNIKVN